MPTDLPFHSLSRMAATITAASPADRGERDNWALLLHDALVQRQQREVLPMLNLVDAGRMLRASYTSQREAALEAGRQKDLIEQSSRDKVAAAEIAVASSAAREQDALQTRDRVMHEMRAAMNKLEELQKAPAGAPAYDVLEQMYVQSKGSMAEQLNENRRLAEELQELRTQLTALQTEKVRVTLTEAEVAQLRAAAAAASAGGDRDDVLVQVPLGSAWIVEDAHGSDVYAVACAAPNTVFTGGAEKLVRSWDVANGRAGPPLSASANVTSIDCQGTVMLVGQGDGACRLFTLRPTPSALAQFTGHGEVVTAVSMTTDATAAVSSSRDQTIRLWDVTRREHVRSIVCHSSCLDVTRSGDTVASAHFDGALRMWDLRSSSSKPVVEAKVHDRSATSVRVTRDGGNLVSLGKDNFVKVTEPRMSASSFGASPVSAAAISFSHPKLSVTHNFARVALSPDGQFCAAGSSSGEVFVFPLFAAGASFGQSGVPPSGTAPVAILTGHTGTVTGITWERTGKGLLSVGLDRRVIMWR